MQNNLNNVIFKLNYGGGGGENLYVYFIFAMFFTD